MTNLFVWKKVLGNGWEKKISLLWIKQLVVHPRAIWVVEEEEWAMFFTYEYVHCVHAPETLERARYNPVSRYSIARLNLDY